MPYDPNTFKNLYPYQSYETIRLILQDKILCGELKIPDKMLNSKSWIKELADKEYKTELTKYKESQHEADAAWQKHQETEHGFSNLPESLRQKIHRSVWEMGYSGGYGEMNNLYCDLVPLVVEAYELDREGCQ